MYLLYPIKYFFFFFTYFKRIKNVNFTDKDGPTKLMGTGTVPLLPPSLNSGLNLTYRFVVNSIQLLKEKKNYLQSVKLNLKKKNYLPETLLRYSRGVLEVEFYSRSRLTRLPKPDVRPVIY